MEEEKNYNFLDQEFTAPGSLLNSKEQRDYRATQLQKQTYDKLQKNDIAYQRFLSNIYGSYENFIQQNKLLREINVFDPTVDFITDVTVVTENAFYKTNHISSQEVIMENLSGVCTVWFTKNDGSTRRLTCTLESKYMPSLEYEVRTNFFSPMAGNRIGVWDINQQAWKSFYMSRVFKFVRDDTVGIE